MNKILFILAAGILTVSLIGCKQERGEDTMKITITVGEKTFSGELYHNDTAEAFAQRLPMTLVMKELNGNEKYSYLSESLL